MEKLVKRILADGIVVSENILKVDSFINHQLDVELANEIGLEFHRRFSNKPINKILTIETSGIAFACLAALHMRVPVVFAKKSTGNNMDRSTYCSEVYSFTKQRCYQIHVSKAYLGPDDHLLIIDDFLANGKALEGLMDICRQSGASVEGVGIVIEKAFQHGGQILRAKGIRIESLAIIESLKEGKIVFKEA